VHRLGHLGHSVLFGFKFGPSVFGKNPGYAVAARNMHAVANWYASISNLHNSTIYLTN
jgi:hypothetical protein